MSTCPNKTKRSTFVDQILQRWHAYEPVIHLCHEGSNLDTKENRRGKHQCRWPKSDTNYFESSQVVYASHGVEGEGRSIGRRRRWNLVIRGTFDHRRKCTGRTYHCWLEEESSRAGWRVRQRPEYGGTSEGATVETFKQIIPFFHQSPLSSLITEFVNPTKHTHHRVWWPKMQQFSHLDLSIFAHLVSDLSIIESCDPCCQPHLIGLSLCCRGCLI